MTRLFDQSERTRIAPATHQMGGYEFLNTSAWNSATYVRALLEEWYDGFPRDPEFVGNFTSRNNNQHWSAFFELFMFQLFRQCSYDVKYHHPIGTRKVDLLADRDQRILLDCTLSGEPNIKQSIATLEKCVLDVVESTPSPKYWICVDFQTATSTTPALGKIRKLLSKTVAILSESDMKDFEIDYEETKWLIKFRFIKKNPPVARSLGSNSSSQGGGFIDGVSTEVLRSTLNSKRGSSYQIEDSAFIVAINTLNPFIDHEVIKQTLFGKPEAPDSQFIKDPYFWQNSKPQNTSVSAVLIAKGLHWSNLGRMELELWHNPWARFPISTTALPINQIVPVLGENNVLLQLDMISGNSTGKILGIQTDYLERD